MKKNNKIKISSRKSVSNKTKKKSIFTQKVKEERIERKKSRKSFEKGIVSKKGMSKVLKSMGGVKKNAPSEEDKIKIAKAQKAVSEERKKIYENRRIAALKRRYSRGEKTPEELKVAIEDLKKSIAETKRYDILATFPKPDKEMIKEMLTNEKINYTLISDDYFWIKDVPNEILEKIRGIMPSQVKIQPYRAKAQNKPVEAHKTKKPTNNTVEVRKAAKTKRKALKIERFKSRIKRVSIKKPLSTSLRRKIYNQPKSKEVA